MHFDEQVGNVAAAILNGNSRPRTNLEANVGFAMLIPP